MKPAKQYSDLMSELLKDLAEMSNSVDVPVGALVLDKNLEVIAKNILSCKSKFSSIDVRC